VWRRGHVRDCKVVNILREWYELERDGTLRRYLFTRVLRRICSVVVYVETCGHEVGCRDVGGARCGVSWVCLCPRGDVRT
jgi:hypothetical protein